MTHKIVKCPKNIQIKMYLPDPKYIIKTALSKAFFDKIID